MTYWERLEEQAEDAARQAEWEAEEAERLLEDVGPEPEPGPYEV